VQERLTYRDPRTCAETEKTQVLRKSQMKKKYLSRNFETEKFIDSLVLSVSRRPSFRNIWNKHHKFQRHISLDN